MSFQDEVETLIRARYPILYILTSEELRIQSLLLGIAQKRQKKLFEWSYSTGLVPAGTNIQSQKSRTPNTRDPLVALDHVIEQVEPAIFLFKDFHPFLTRSNFAVIRKLKDIALHLKNSFKTIVLVGSVMEMPSELEKEITLLNYPLPTREDMGQLLDKILADVSQFKQIKIDLDGSGRDRLLQAALGLTLGEAENVFAKIIVKDERLSGEDVNEVFAEKQQIVKKSGLLEYYATQESFASVGGLMVLKDWLTKRAQAFSPAAREFGLPAPRGILMLGVQGCGKSLCAKAVSNVWQLPLLRFDMGRMFGSLVGSSEENVRRAISVAESCGWMKSTRRLQDPRVPVPRTAAPLRGCLARFSPGFPRKAPRCSSSPPPTTFHTCPPNSSAKAAWTRSFLSTCPARLKERRFFASTWPNVDERSRGSTSIFWPRTARTSAGPKSRRLSTARCMMPSTPRWTSRPTMSSRR
jgi:hypothetical protein